jgi:dTDP-4-dehydrorhamnose reductase
MVTGAGGQLGRELPAALAELGNVIVTNRSDLDLMIPDDIRSLMISIKPDIIINAAAYTAVDRAESEPAAAMQINATAPGIMAEEAKRLGSLLLHFSTDYVFDGSKQTPYLEDDPATPQNQYGRSKLVGEQAIRAVGCRHLILRTSWVFGCGNENFPAKIARAAMGKTELSVVSDQYGSPTNTKALAKATASLIPLAGTRGIIGTYHAASIDWCSRFEFASAILEQVQKPHVRTLLRPVKTNDFSSPAKRPLNTALDCTKLLKDTGIHLPPWREQLRAYEVMQGHPLKQHRTSVSP